jgi:hypothetical protein
MSKNGTPTGEHLHLKDGDTLEIVSDEAPTKSKRDEGPVFDFGRVRGSWRRGLLKLTALEARTTEQVNRVTSDPNNTDADIEAALGAAAALESLQGELMAQVLVSLPRSWLVNDAPEDVDFSDPATFDLVRQDRRSQVYMEMMVKSQRPAGKA